MAGNELLEVLWGGAIEATVSKRQNFVIDALIHRQPVKLSPDRFDMLCHFFCASHCPCCGVVDKLKTVSF